MDEPELPKPGLRLVVSKGASFLARRADYRPIRRTRVDELLSEPLEGKVVWTSSVMGLLVECRRKRYWKTEPEFSFHCRDVSIRILSGEHPCCVGTFVEWKGDGLADGEEFFYEADGLSQEDSDTASLLLSCWDDDELPFDYGTVVRFDRVVVDWEIDRPPLAFRALAAAIVKEFGSRGAAMILKAFPLEFEGVGATASGNGRFLDSRQAAMKRHYRRQLGARPLPGLYGEEGWLWYPLRYCPEPQKR